MTYILFRDISELSVPREKKEISHPEGLNFPLHIAAKLLQKIEWLLCIMSLDYLVKRIVYKTRINVLHNGKIADLIRLFLSPKYMFTTMPLTAKLFWHFLLSARLNKQLYGFCLFLCPSVRLFRKVFPWSTELCHNS